MTARVQKIGVVVQGPLVTYGQGPNNAPQGFDTSLAILANVRNLIKINASYVVCTWNCTSVAEKNALQQLLTHEINVRVIDSPEISDPDHRYKHHYGTMKGLEFLDSPIVVKIRTDMVLPESFWDWVGGINDDRLVVSELITPFYLGDFIYAGKRNIVIDYLTGIISHEDRVIHPSITTDLGFKYYNHLNAMKLNGFQLLCSHLINPTSLVKNWEKFAITNIRTIPLYIYQCIEWRGRPIDEIINITAFKFDTIPPYHPAEVDFLLGEYIRFYVKRKDWRQYLVRIFVRLLKIYRRLYRIPRRILSIIRFK